MKLSERQVRIVNAFLRECGEDANAGPETARTATVTRIRRELRDELARRDDSMLRDDELIRLLNRLQFPERAAMADAAVQAKPAGDVATDPVPLALVAASLVVVPIPEVRAAELQPVAPSAKPAPGAQVTARMPSGPLASSLRVWLGVCLALGEQIGQPVNRVRAAFVVAGLVTGPAALTAYLVAYAVYYVGRHGVGAPHADARAVARAAAEPIAVLSVMAMVFAGGRWGIDAVYAMTVGYTPELGTWASFTQSVWPLLIGTASATIPIAALSALPVAPPWDANLRRLVRAGLACVGGILALGLASYLAGALIDAAQNWSI